MYLCSASGSLFDLEGWLNENDNSNNNNNDNDNLYDNDDDDDDVDNDNDNDDENNDNNWLYLLSVAHNSKHWKKNSGPLVFAE